MRNAALVLCAVLVLSAGWTNRAGILARVFPPEPERWTGGLIGVWNEGGSKGNVILHQGHTCFSPYNETCSTVGRLDTVAVEFAKAGFAVYGMEMPPRPHDNRPLSDFTKPVTELLDSIGPAYMIGLSGGGWTTTVVTATDSRIIHGFSVAGDFPEDLRTHPDDVGDFEQRGIAYRELYKKAHGRLTHIYILDDPCCYAGRRLPEDPGYEFIIDGTTERHEISDAMVALILARL